MASSRLFAFGQDALAKHVSAQQIKALCQAVYRRDQPLVLKDGDCLFCQTDLIYECFAKIRLTPHRCVLVTGESDHVVTPAVYHSRPWNVVSWFAVNREKYVNGLHVLPLGIANDYCQITLKADRIADGLIENEDRPKWLYVNHRVETNPAVRQKAYDELGRYAGEPWITLRTPWPAGAVDDYQTELRQHRYICCPPGNGPDTHRFWEALYSKTIPVVLRSELAEAFRDLPVLFVEDYAELTLERLQTHYAEIQEQSWKFDRLFTPYWQEQLAGARQAALRTSRLELLRQWIQRRLTP